MDERQGGSGMDGRRGGSTGERMGGGRKGRLLGMGSRRRALAGLAALAGASRLLQREAGVVHAARSPATATPRHRRSPASTRPIT